MRPGRNVWCVKPAARAAVLVDAASYYGALRAALRQARRSVYVVAWDLDSRTPLVGEAGEPDDGLPVTLSNFLTALVKQRPQLEVRLLLWDYSVLYSFERELLPVRALGWNTPPQVQYRLDNLVPFGSSQHQKLVVIDDAVAFVGGLDLTIRRWDTAAHVPDNPQRVDPSGAPYPPFHDVQMMVDGDAAAALAGIARRRWAHAAGEKPPPTVPLSDPWPEQVMPQFRNVPVGISRTRPRHAGEPEVREVETLFHDMVRAARRSIYVENQFLTSPKIAASLIGCLRRRPALEVAIVTPQGYPGWLESRVMLSGRTRFMALLRQAGLLHRVRLLYPQVRHGDNGAAVMVHSKLMIVDDRLLRVGSANLCNRSMGVDTECDLVIEARGDGEATAIAALRDQLVAEHCGAGTDEVQAAMRRTGSLFATLDALQGRDRRLCPIADGAAELDALIEGFADPEEPIAAAEYLAEVVGEPASSSGSAPALVAACIAATIALLVLAWRYTPLAALASPELLAQSLADISSEPWAVAMAIAIFVAGGLVAFPVTVLIAGTAVAFGTWLGLVVAGTGALTSALVTYMVGRLVGAGPLRRMLGPRIGQLSRSIASRGILAITAVRLVPIAPFTLINLVAGATRIAVLDYMVGTALGLAPGLVLLSALGQQVFEVIRDPTPAKVLLFILLLLIWFGLVLALQSFAARLRRRRG